MEIETHIYVARRIGELATRLSDYTHSAPAPEKIMETFDKLYTGMERTMNHFGMDFSSIETATLVMDAIEESLMEKYSKTYKEISH